MDKIIRTIIREECIYGMTASRDMGTYELITPRTVASWLHEYQDRKFSGSPVYLAKSSVRTNKGWTYTLRPVEVQQMFRHEVYPSVF